MDRGFPTGDSLYFPAQGINDAEEGGSFRFGIGQYQMDLSARRVGVEQEWDMAWGLGYPLFRVLLRRPGINRRFCAWAFFGLCEGRV